MVLVILAEGGLALDFSLATYGDRVETLSQHVEQHIGVPKQRQIFLSESGDKLSVARSAFSQHKISDDDTVFLFDTESTQRPAQPVSVGDDDGKWLPLPPQSVNFSHPLLSSTSVLVRAIPHFISNFQLHAAHAKDILELCDRRAAQCEDLQQQISNQSAAVHALQLNSSTMYRAFASRWSECAERYRSVRATCDPLVASFETDLARLASLPLHPRLVRTGSGSGNGRGLASPQQQAAQQCGRATLLDCIPELELRAQRDECVRGIHALEAQLQHLNAAFHDLDAEHSAECVNRTPHYLNASPALLRDRVAEVRALCDHTRQVVEALDADAARIAQYEASLLDAGAQTQHLAVGDHCALFEAADGAHTQNLLPNAVQCAARAGQTLIDLRAAKAAMSEYFLRHLKVLGAFHGRVKAGTDLLHTLDAGLRHLPLIVQQTLGGHGSVAGFGAGDASGTGSFGSVLAQFPDTHAACLVEIARRREFGRFLTTRSGAFAESLDAARNEECARREAFLAAHAPSALAWLGVDAVLSELPPPLTMCAFDADLPSIDASDLGADLARAVPSVGAAVVPVSTSSSSASASSALPASDLASQMHALQELQRKLDAERQQYRGSASDLMVAAAGGAKSEASISSSSPPHIRIPAADETLSPMSKQRQSGLSSVRSGVSDYFENGDGIESDDEDQPMAVRFRGNASGNDNGEASELLRAGSASPSYVNKRQLDDALSEIAVLSAQLAKARLDGEDLAFKIAHRFLPAERELEELRVLLVKASSMQADHEQQVADLRRQLSDLEHEHGRQIAVMVAEAADAADRAHAATREAEAATSFARLQLSELSQSHSDSSGVVGAICTDASHQSLTESVARLTAAIGDRDRTIDARNAALDASERELCIAKDEAAALLLQLNDHEPQQRGPQLAAGGNRGIDGGDAATAAAARDTRLMLTESQARLAEFEWTLHARPALNAFAAEDMLLIHNLGSSCATFQILHVPHIVDRADAAMALSPSSSSSSLLSRVASRLQDVDLVRQIKSLTVAELRDRLVRSGLETGGLKAVLVERLLKAHADNSIAADQAATASAAGASAAVGEDIEYILAPETHEAMRLVLDQHKPNTRLLQAARVVCIQEGPGGGVVAGRRRVLELLCVPIQTIIASP